MNAVQVHVLKLVLTMKKTPIQDLNVYLLSFTHKASKEKAKNKNEDIKSLKVTVKSQ